MFNDLQLFWLLTITLFYSTYGIFRSQPSAVIRIVRLLSVVSSVVFAATSIESYVQVLQLSTSIFSLLLVVPYLSSRPPTTMSRLFKVNPIMFLAWSNILYWQGVLHARIAREIPTAQLIVSVVMVISLGVAVGLLGYVIFRFSRSRFTINDKLVTGKSLPTVTLAVPARNETHALTESLRSSIESEYKKLEILVLDDCSQDDTAQIIKSFAHDGVRFVQGQPPKDQWLGKNSAYQALLKQASGSYIVFSGVDVHVKPHSIDQIITTMINESLDMISVLPINSHKDWLTSLLQPLRYLRVLVSSEPAASSFWVIKTEYLESLGGFESVKHLVEPEVALSKDAKYRFFVSNTQLGIRTRKRFNSQFETATRTLFPFTQSSFFNAYMVLVGVAVLMLLPYVVSAMQLVGDEPLLYWSWLAYSTVIVYTVLQIVLLRILRPRSWLIGVVSFPFAVVVELVALVWSVASYATGKAAWKGRNICLPVLTAIRKLPDLS